MTIASLDHLVLTVRDVATASSCYRDMLGMEIVQFDGGRTALRFGTQKINLHPASAPIAPHATHSLPGSAD